MGSADGARAGRAAGYAWRETPSDLEVRVPVPPGTKRSELNVALEDHHGRNVWRNEHETSGGAEVSTRPRLRVRPVFWPAPLLDGELVGRVKLAECSFEMDGDSLLVSLKKAAGEGWWDGVLREATAGDAATAAAPPRAGAAGRRGGARAGDGGGGGRR